MRENFLWKEKLPKMMIIQENETMPVMNFSNVMRTRFSIFIYFCDSESKREQMFSSSELHSDVLKSICPFKKNSLHEKLSRRTYFINSHLYQLHFLFYIYSFKKSSVRTKKNPLTYAYSNFPNVPRSVSRSAPFTQLPLSLSCPPRSASSH